MNTIKLYITDQRMIQVMDYVIQNRIQSISTKNAFADALNMHRSNLTAVFAGNRSFTVEQLVTCSYVFGIDANYLFGTSDMMLREERNSVNPLDLIRLALHELEDKNNTGKVQASSKAKAIK